MSQENAVPNTSVNSIVHTPGPWVYDSGCFYAKCQLDEYGLTYESPIAELLEGRPFNTDGNAKLIAAAPEILESLESLIELYEQDEETTTPGTDAHTAMTLAKIVVAKARGALVV